MRRQGLAMNHEMRGFLGDLIVLLQEKYNYL
jgi:hypothetical protein